jgi:hypothetical protein
MASPAACLPPHGMEQTFLLLVWRSRRAQTSAAVYTAWCAKLIEFLAVIGVEGGNGSCIGHMDMGRPPGIASLCAWLIGQWALGRQNYIMLRCRLHTLDIFERRLWGK